MRVDDLALLFGRGAQTITIKEWTRNGPGAHAFKLCAREVGLVKGESADGSEILELVPFRAAP